MRRPCRLGRKPACASSSREQAGGTERGSQQDPNGLQQRLQNTPRSSRSAGLSSSSSTFIMLSLLSVVITPATNMIDSPPLRVIDPRVDWLHEPLGIDSVTPHFSWALLLDDHAAHSRGLVQTSYRIVVRTGAITVWDSGNVTSAAMANVAYGGKPLARASRATLMSTCRPPAGH